MIFSLSLVTGWFLFAGTTKTNWSSGRVVSASMNGTGSSNTESRNTDLWWNYCISTENQCYSVVSREGPAQLGLANNKSVRFFINRNLLYIQRPNGKNASLRILRRDKGKTCPQ